MLAQPTDPSTSDLYLFVPKAPGVVTLSVAGGGLSASASVTILP